MQFPIEIQLLPHAMPELFAQVTSTGKLTIADRYGLLAAMLENPVKAEDCQIIDRLFHGVRRGRIKVVDDLSSIR